MKTVICTARKIIWRYFSANLPGIPKPKDLKLKTLAETAFPDHNNIKLYESLFWSTFNKLPENCKELLMLHWKERDNKEISNQLSIDEAYVGERKTECILYFLQVVKNHQEYSQFKKTTLNH